MPKKKKPPNKLIPAVVEGEEKHKPKKKRRIEPSVQDGATIEGFSRRSGRLSGKVIYPLFFQLFMFVAYFLNLIL